MTEPMSRGALWQALKETGWKPPTIKPFVKWTTEELEEEYNTVLARELVNETMGIPPENPHEPAPDPELEGWSLADFMIADEEASALAVVPEAVVSNASVIEPPRPEFDAPWDPQAPPVAQPAPVPAPQPAPAPPRLGAQSEADAGTRPPTALEVSIAQFPGVPVSDEADERAGLRMNTHGPNDAVRIDSRGRVWFQDEVLKPSMPKPRARRKQTFRAASAKTVETRNKLGLLEESFEISGEDVHDMVVKTTLPPSQVGIYKDPSHPFRIHVYNGARGYSRRDILEYYGGAMHVPSSCKEIYVGGDSCYDITSVKDTIETEFRERVLQIQRPFS